MLVTKILGVIPLGSGDFVLYLQWRIGTSWSNLTFKLYKPCCNPLTLKNELVGPTVLDLCGPARQVPSFQIQVIFRSLPVLKAQLNALSPQKEEGENDTRNKALLAGEEPATSSRWEGEQEDREISAPNLQYLCCYIPSSV